MSSIPFPKVEGVGRVRWRCEACGELIEGEPVWAERRVMASKGFLPSTEHRAFHPEHLPADVRDWSEG